MRVLFKEDDPLVARTLERQLRKLGHATEQIIDFRLLLNGECELNPEVIITDIFMPDIEGLDFIRRIKNSTFCNVPIIAISGGGNYMGGIPNVEYSFVAKAAIAFGARAFLPKPVLIGDLKHALNGCTRRSALKP